MANTINLEVITPSKLFYRGSVELVIVRTLTGDEGFMANHAWACKLLDVGEMWIQEPGSENFRIAAIAGGFVDVKENIVIYTDAAEWGEEIDMERALSEKTNAENWLVSNKERAGDPELDKEIALAKISLQKQITRMNVAGGGSRRRK